MRTQNRCRKCSAPKPPGRCRPCRAASLRAWATAHRDDRNVQARARYRRSAELREASKQRNYRWRRDNRAHYLTSKREQGRRRTARARKAA